MFYRKGCGQIEAIQFDGSERAARNIRHMRGARAVQRKDRFEIMTSFGRASCRLGQWVARDVATGAIQVLDGGEFPRAHEAAY